MSCLILTPEIRELATKFPNENEQSILNLVGMWQEKNNKSPEDIPSGSELNAFIKELRKPTNISWARTAENGYEVSTRGDKRFSALVATFNKGTIIDGVDVSGRTIEDVYQSVIKKSRKGQAPSKDSIVSLDRMNDEGVPAWLFDGTEKLIPEDLWYKLYGVYTSGFEAIGESTPDITKKDMEDFSYYVGYLPLWQEWARQNPQLIDELRVKAQGRTLTDQFANTRVSQARALSEILSGPETQVTEERPSDAFNTPRVTTVEEQQKVDLLFDPRVRRDRVSLIARFFSNEIDTALQEEEETLKRKINDAETQEEEEDLQSQLGSLDRLTIIKRLTPAGIFRRVCNIFASYVNDTEEGRIQQELNAINSQKGSEKYSDEQKREAAKKKAAYKLQEYKKIVDDPYVYKALASSARAL